MDIQYVFRYVLQTWWCSHLGSYSGYAILGGTEILEEALLHPDRGSKERQKVMDQLRTILKALQFPSKGHESLTKLFAVQDIVHQKNPDRTVTLTIRMKPIIEFDHLGNPTKISET